MNIRASSAVLFSYSRMNRYRPATGTKHDHRNPGESRIHTDPFSRFSLWYNEAAAAAHHDSSAMTLATAGKEGRVSARIVLLKKWSHDGFIFFTNYKSLKGRQMEENPLAALVFYWPETGKQVRIEGRVRKIPGAVSDDYFSGRPRGSRLSAWASPQSDVIPGAVFIRQQMAVYRKRFPGRQIPRPPHWGGYCLVPDMFEFWKGGHDRLHDRIRYRLVRGRWIIERLAP